MPDTEFSEKTYELSTTSVTQREVIPYIDELTKSVDYDMATDKSAGSKLKHMMILTRKLPELITEMKQKYE